MILFSFHHKSNPPSSVLSFLVPSAHAPFLDLICLMFLLSLVLSSLHSDPSKDTTSFPPSSLPPSLSAVPPPLSCPHTAFRSPTFLTASLLGLIVVSASLWSWEGCCPASSWLCWGSLCSAKVRKVQFSDRAKA